MNRQEQHEMILEKTHSSGGEEWACPECGRRMIITWYPWKRIIIEQGDIYAAHSGSKGGLKFGSEVIAQDNQMGGSEESASDEHYLAPWQRWLDSVDSDDLWNREL